MYTHILSGVIGWIKTHGFHTPELKERGAEIWVFDRTWKKATFRRILVAMLSRYSGSSAVETTAFWRIVVVADLDFAVVTILCWPPVLLEAFTSYLGSGFRQTLIEHPMYDLRSACSELLRVFVESSTLFYWQNSSSTASRESRLETGWYLDLPSEGLLLPLICQFFI